MYYHPLRGFISLAEMVSEEPVPAMLTESSVQLDLEHQPGFDTVGELEKVIFDLVAYQPEGSDEFMMGHDTATDACVRRLRDFIDEFRKYHGT